MLLIACLIGGHHGDTTTSSRRCAWRLAEALTRLAPTDWRSWQHQPVARQWNAENLSVAFADNTLQSKRVEHLHRAAFGVEVAHLIAGVRAPHRLCQIGTTASFLPLDAFLATSVTPQLTENSPSRCKAVVWALSTEKDDAVAPVLPEALHMNVSGGDQFGTYLAWPSERKLSCGLFLLNCCHP